ncbi:MAG TPA: hypothetical protein VFQ91_27615 [Bryobacteraceae bacterium]|nr:hypothetical protein [Bryobacteraceae bacterium]
MDTTEIAAVMRESQAGKLIFPAVVERLLAAGVESYFVDFAKATENFYGVEGGTYAEPMHLPGGPVAADFSAAGIREAIRAAQGDRIRYPEFVERARAAGVAGYWAYLTGRRVLYLGRKGEMHVEEFPAAA